MKRYHFKFKRLQPFWRMLLCLAAVFPVAGVAGKIFAGGITRVIILESARIDDENIILGAIARIEGDDQLLIQKLGDIVITRAPQPGQSRELEPDYLKMRLRQNGFDPAEAILQIPPKVVVTRSFTEIGAEKVAALVADYILKNSSMDRGDLRIKDIRVEENVRLPGGRITYKVIAPRNADLVGKIPFSVIFDANGSFQQRISAIATVEVLADVVVTRKPLARHQPITEEDIELQKMDFGDLPSDVLTNPEEVIGKRTRRAIGAQTALRADQVELPPLVKRGDMVVIIAESGGLKITALGQVKKKGRLGERIPVINFDSQKILYARVVDAKTVKVEF